MSNFGFLAERSALLAELGATAERLFPFDPASSVLKLRLPAEAITHDIAARLDFALVQPSQAELLRAVDARLGMAICGELVPQDPAGEAASESLTRLAASRTAAPAAKTRKPRQGQPAR